MTRRVIMPGVTRKGAAEPRTIKRYGNRKLYDPATRRYGTLQQLARLVARGENVRVLDQRNGLDLTNLTLAQALLESVRQGASRIPHQVLTRLIRIAAGPAAGWGEWPEPEEAAGRARLETERLVSRLLGTGRLSLDDAVALRGDLAELVHRLVTDAQTGVEVRLRGLLSRGEEAAERSLGALRGRLEAYIDKPSKDRKRKPRRPRARAGRSRK
jgi:polyhydroxyalkanoate synthesis repressor PhaR